MERNVLFVVIYVYKVENEKKLSHLIVKMSDNDKGYIS